PHPGPHAREPGHDRQGHRAFPSSSSGFNKEKRIWRDTADGARPRQGGHADRAARHRRHRAHRPHGRVLEGVRRETAPAIRLGRMNVLKEIESRALKAVRFSFADQHGILRGKTLASAEVSTALERGVTVSSPLPYCTRQLLRKAIKSLGYDFIAGLEVEFHVFRILNANLKPSDAGQPGTPPDVELLSTGYQYLTEQRYDLIDPVVQILRKDLESLGLPLRSFEVEFGPSQLEFTLSPLPGLEAADAMLLLRSAVKQIARRHGYHATFMCRPKLPNVMSSGWHLHQSLQKNGVN